MSIAGPPEAAWRAALAEGRMLVQRSRESGRCIFPPRLAVPGSGDDDLEWIEIGGGGIVYSLTWIGRKPPAGPYNVVIVELDEGPRMMSRVEDVSPATLAIGQRVTAHVVAEEGVPLIVFRPATPA